jgi:hypothetical protein
LGLVYLGHFCFAHGLVFWTIPCALPPLWQRWLLPLAQQFRWLCSSAAVVAARGPFVKGKAVAVRPDAANAAQTGGGGGEGSGGVCASGLLQLEPAGLELEPRTLMQCLM